MPVYEIIPHTNLSSKFPPIGFYSYKVGLDKCRELCDDNDKCMGFTWTDEDIGICKLREAINAGTTKDSSDNTVLYIKRGNSNYWLLWTFLILLGIIFFISWGRK